MVKKKIDWVRICQGIGRDAAKEIMRIYATERRAEELGIGYGGDMTLEADQAAEDIVVSKLKELGIGVKLVSEEAGEMFIGEKPEYTFVVDPLDGSFNFKVGFDYFAVSIAVLDKKNKPVAGYVMNVPNGTEYYATQEGVFKNGKKIKASKKKTAQNVLLECSKKSDPCDIKFLAKMFLKIRHARAPGAVALDLCKVADGTFDCLLYSGASRYVDVAAGIYIVEKAGGVVSDFDGNKKIREGTLLKAKNLLVAANKNLHKSLVGERVRENSE